MIDEQTKSEIVRYRCQKAYSLLTEVDILMENELWNSTVNRMYYACFHMVSALLIQYDLEVKSHMGLRQAFGLHFVKKGLLPIECGRIFSKIYDKRQSSDYDDFRDFSKEEVEALYPQVFYLINEVGKLLNQD